jgi:hypothetical protein
VLAVEACLIEGLTTLFCPGEILDIDDELVATLAAEDEETSIERERCSDKLKVLKDGLRELKSVQEYSSSQFKGK